MLAILLCILTFFSINETSTFLSVEMAVIFVLIIFLIKKIAFLWRDVRKTRLHMQFVLIFGLVTIIPLVLVGAFCASFINAGIESWFTSSAKKALFEAKTVADAYIKEQKRSIKQDAQSIVKILHPHILINQSTLFESLLNDIAHEKNVREILIIQDNAVILKSYFSFLAQMEKIDEESFKKARAGDIVISIREDRIRALILLDEQNKIYLLIGKMVDSKILSHVKATDESIESYNKIYDKKILLQTKFIAFFAAIVMLLLLFAIWMGFSILDMILKPIRKWINGAESVSLGDLSVRLEHYNLDNELDDLTFSFNKMVSKLQKQQHDLKSSQRKAAWADAARKIAHEIKNPLTPIQLSAERIKRKYTNEILTDKNTFIICIETIIRQVESIKKLIKDFSDFAKESKPNLQNINIYDLIYGIVLLQKQSNPDIDFKVLGNMNTKLYCDGLQMNQVFNNLILNSINSLLENSSLKKMLISVKIIENDFDVTILVIDNGIGFPEHGKEKFFDPYYTTREKGTGLGLFVVYSIVTAHGGSIELMNLDKNNDDHNNHSGACVKLVFEKNKGIGKNQDFV